ncbi:21781_t:CDS:2, partial [Cetraspora pellucida]
MSQIDDFVKILNDISRTLSLELDSPKNLIQYVKDNKLLSYSDKKAFIDDINKSIFYDQLNAKKHDEKFKKLNAKCINCQYDLYENFYCIMCVRSYLENNFTKWTSGNKILDSGIRFSQLKYSAGLNIVEWIPFENFFIHGHKTDGGYGSIYVAYWIDGPIYSWNDYENQFLRGGSTLVILKSMRNFNNQNEDFYKEVLVHIMLTSEIPHLIKCYGLTKDPENENYMMVLSYAFDGDLKDFLKKNNFTWKERYSLLCDITLALLKLHEHDIIHRDLHPGNILITGNSWKIGDLGISKFSDDKSKSEIIGVLPYIAPEALIGSDYTTAVDIYSIGIIMWQIVCNHVPYWDRNHDISLARDIYFGLRPPKIPGLLIGYEEIMEKCWNSDASFRPSALELYEFSKKNYQEIC